MMNLGKTHKGFFGVSTVLISIFGLFLFSCDSFRPIEEEVGEPVIITPPEEEEEEASYLLPDIDLNHWKVTLPIGNAEGKPIEVHPPEILDYATNETLRPFMYNDSTDGALVFYTYPGVTTTNSTRSRTELREQMEPGNNSLNWSFSEGGRMRGTLAMADISKDANNAYHSTIIMQIHGRLSNEQRDLIGASDNNAPPILKISWNKGRVRLKSKVLKDVNASDTEILHTSAWGDDVGYNFQERVDFNKFTLEIVASEGRMEVTLNDGETVVYEGVDMERWGVFENYFKAGNYLQTSDEGAFAKVKYYDLVVEH